MTVKDKLVSQPEPSTPDEHISSDIWMGNFLCEQRRGRQSHFPNNTPSQWAGPSEGLAGQTQMMEPMSPYVWVIYIYNEFKQLGLSTEYLDQPLETNILQTRPVPRPSWVLQPPGSF